MSKMTLEQEEVRNQEYNEYVEQMTPKHNLWANMGKAFLLGGGICLQIAAGVFGLKAEDAALWCSLLLVLLSVILTSCNVYGILANWGGAGALVPITGFANGVCASAVEFQKEGQVFGIGCQIILNSLGNCVARRIEKTYVFLCTLFQFCTYYRRE